MHITQRRGHSLKACLLWLWLCLLGMPSHALTLGDLAVSSSAAPSFSASFPFSDDRPVRLAEMQARVATRGEYARWGYPVPSVLRELRVRVVPASETVGYVELYSPTPLSQNNFDLLVWSTYAGQTTMTHYRVGLNEVPSLIKGRALSSSQVLAPIPSPAATTTASEKTKKTATRNKTTAPTDPAHADASKTREAEPTPASNVTAQDTPAAAEMAVEPTHPTFIATAVNGASNDQHAVSTANATVTSAASASEPSDGGFSTGGSLLVVSLVLFLLGFLLGKLRNNKAPTSDKPLAPPIEKDEPVLHAVPRESRHPSTTPRTAAQPPQAQPASTGFLAAAPSTTLTPSLSASQTGIRMPPSAFAHSKGDNFVAPSTHEEHDPMFMTTSSTTVSAVSRVSAAALPTPGLATGQPRGRKTGTAKSAGSANIDLAKIYLSMGDPSTAQMVLQQVMEQGTDLEKAAAEQLLQGIV